MGESGRSDLATVRSVGSVRDEVDTHFSFGCLDGRVGLAWWDGVALREDLSASADSPGPSAERIGKGSL